MLTPGAPRDPDVWTRARYIPLAAAVPAWLATTATVVSAVSAVAGVGMSVLGGIQQSKAASAQASATESAAKQQQMLAGRAANDQRAASQREAAEQRRRGTLAQSRGLAVAAASGAGASDPTVTDIMSDLAGEGEYNALSALYSGESQAVAIENNARAGTWEAQTQAAALRAKGRAAKLSGIVGGVGTALSGATSWFSDYGSQFFSDNGQGGNLMSQGGSPLYGNTDTWSSYFS